MKPLPLTIPAEYRWEEEGSPYFFYLDRTELGDRVTNAQMRERVFPAETIGERVRSADVLRSIPAGALEGGAA